MANFVDEDDDFYESLANLTQTSNEDSMLNRPFDEEDSDDEDFIMASPVFGVVFDEIDGAILKDEKSVDLPLVENSQGHVSGALSDDVVVHEITQDHHQIDRYVTF